MPGSEGSVDLPAAVYGPVDSVYVWGDEPAAVNLLLWTIAQRVNPESLWVVLRAKEELARVDPIRLGWVPTARVRYARSSPAPASPVVPSVGVLELIRADERSQNVRLLVDFLSLPAQLQELLAEEPAEGAIRAVVFEHAEAIAEHLPADAEVSSAYVRIFRHEGVKLLVSYLGRPRHDRFVFDHVYRVQSSPAGDWREAELLREQGTPGPPFEMGRGVPVMRLAAFRSAAERATG